MDLICRAHQLVQEGFKYSFDEKLITVWSAPNYCYRCANVAAILVFNQTDSKEAKIFEAVPSDERSIPNRKCPYFL